MVNSDIQDILECSLTISIEILRKCLPLIKQLYSGMHKTVYHRIIYNGEKLKISKCKSTEDWLNKLLCIFTMIMLIFIY